MTDSQFEGLRRRRFFREAVARLVSPLAEYIERRAAPSRMPIRLRPPGAIDEADFLETCQRCGHCVDVCPAGAILSLHAGAGKAAGTPIIDPDRAACVVCDGLVCTTGCPSGALRPLTLPSEIRMGVASVYEPVCVRTNGESCTLCVDRCPLGESAIRFEGPTPPRVLPGGCVGCGICQLYCPSSPKAIVVVPAQVAGVGHRVEDPLQA